MKTKSLLMILGAILLSICLFSSCSSDDDGGGNSSIYGTYATESQYFVADKKNRYRNVIILTKTSFKTVQAVDNNNSFDGMEAIAVPNMSGWWYHEYQYTQPHSYIISGNNIVLDDGRLYSIGNGTIIGGGKTYHKVK